MNEEQLKLLLAKPDNFSNFEIFQKVFGFFFMNLTGMHRWNHLNVSARQFFVLREEKVSIRLEHPIKLI